MKGKSLEIKRAGSKVWRRSGRDAGSSMEMKQSKGPQINILNQDNAILRSFKKAKCKTYIDPSLKGKKF